MAKLVSKVYGEALFEIAMEAGTDRMDDLLSQVQQMEAVLKANPEFEKLMLHPGIPKQDKVSAMENVFKGRISDELTGLMERVIQKERYSELPEIFAYFTARVKAEKGIGVAHITSAVPLSKEQQAATVARLLETTGYQSIETNYTVDEALIGGMVIRINDRVVDSSVRSKLNDLTRQLLQIQLG